MRPKPKPKTKSILLRLTPAELSELQAAANRAALPLSTWLRALALVEARKA